MNTSYPQSLSAQVPPPALPLVHVFPRRELSKGDSLYREGDAADTLFRVEEGLLKLTIDLVTGKERIVSIAGPGDFIGAITPSHVAQQESAEVLSPVALVQVIPQAELGSSLHGDSLQREVHAAAGVRLKRMRNTLEDSELPVPARLARTFVRLGERFGTLSDDNRVHLTLPLTHDNLAAMVGSARETTTAVLSDMRDHGLVAGTRGRYSFNRVDLQDYALEASFAY